MWVVERVWRVLGGDGGQGCSVRCVVIEGLCVGDVECTRSCGRVGVE